jgi:nucleoid-associated protein YgaU
MRVSRALPSATALLLLSGCGYVHFGRLPKLSTDSALQQAYVDLGTQQKILKQELAIARKENDTLRAALDRGAGTATANTELPQQLEATTRELATLRANYAKLQGERDAAVAQANAAASAASLQSELDTVRQHEARLTAENAQLRRDLDSARADNATLAQQLKTSLAENEQSRSTLAQLNTDLLAQKQARAAAEQATADLRAQLDAVVARAGRSDNVSPAAAESSATTTGSTAIATPTSFSALQLAKAPPSDAAPLVELHTNPARVRAVSTPAPTGEAASAAPATTASSGATEIPTTAASPAVEAPTTTSGSNTTATPAAARSYTVQKGDTLEKIARQFYGSADQWTKIYAANMDALSSGQGLKPGMELQIPEK